MLLKIRIVFVLSIMSSIIFSQSDTVKYVLPKVISIKALKISTPQLKTTYSVNHVEAKAYNQKLSLIESLNQVPGLYALNANNFAQDLRISIRGFGARSAFGIRGIKLIVDGIPETTPDGQGQLDNINIEGISNLQIVKGAASAEYGNAAGGVIQINSNQYVKDKAIKLGFSTGSYGFNKFHLNTAFRFDSTQLRLVGEHVSLDGYREHNEMSSTNVNLNVKHTFTNKSTIGLIANYTDSPKANDPGSQNIDQTVLDRQAARPANVDFNSGEAIQHYKVGLVSELRLNNSNKVNMYSFFSGRKFDGRLPFSFGGAIDLDRTYYGAGLSLTNTKAFDLSVNTLKAGVEYAYQNDDRKRFENLGGIQGDQTLSQNEIFDALGFYIVDQFEKGPLLIDASLRYDMNVVTLEDRFLSNGDASDELDKSAISYGIGLSYALSERHRIFGNIRTSFELPTLSEFSADPSGEGGLNDALAPLRATNYELGIKSNLNRFYYDLTVFYIRSTNELVPYELDAFPGRTFFQNASATDRQGIEGAFEYRFNKAFNIRGTYSYAKMTFQDFIIDQDDFSGNQLPGIPQHYGGLALEKVFDFGLSCLYELNYRSQLFTNNSNTVDDPSFILSNIKVGYPLNVSNYTLLFTGGINNLFNTKYNDNIRINAFGQRFFEPAPEMNYYFGVSVSL